MVYELVRIGRGKFCGTVEVVDEEELLREVSKHLRSNDVEIVWVDEEARRGVVCAGLHLVGEVFRNRNAEVPNAS